VFVKKDSQLLKAYW